MSAEKPPDIHVRRQGRAGRITLDRPKALNALTYAQVGVIARALDEWAREDAVELVILDGAGDRGLCAGGDVRSLYDSRVDGSGFARTFWRDEYRLNARIARYPKPFVAIQDGIVMGGGIGLSAHASHRVVTERSALAMPETGIGLIPDVGGTWLLAHAPGAAGAYLGLTGERMTASDAIYAGFADSFVPSYRLPVLIGELVDKGMPGAAIATHSGDLGASPLAARAALIDDAFRFPAVEQIISRLEGAGTPEAAKIIETLRPRSPKAMKLTLAAIRQARAQGSLEAALGIEYRLVVRLFEDGEFPEGIRAALVDKDRLPRWTPATLDEFTDRQVAAYLAPLPEEEELRIATDA